MTDTPAPRPDQVTWTHRPGYEDAGSATLLYYTTDEGREGKETYLEKRKPDFSRFKRYP